MVLQYIHLAQYIFLHIIRHLGEYLKSVGWWLCNIGSKKNKAVVTPIVYDHTCNDKALYAIVPYIH